MDLREAAARDPVLSAVIRALTSSEPCPHENEEVRFYLNEGQSSYLRVSDGLLMHSRIDERESKVVVPSSVAKFVELGVKDLRSFHAIRLV